ncbi:unnamed protein product [Boreogadus saida]
MLSCQGAGNSIGEAGRPSRHNQPIKRNAPPCASCCQRGAAAAALTLRVLLHLQHNTVFSPYGTTVLPGLLLGAELQPAVEDRVPHRSLPDWSKPPEGPSGLKGPCTWAGVWSTNA